MTKKKDSDRDIFFSCGRALSALREKAAYLRRELSVVEMAIKTISAERDVVEAKLKKSGKKALQ